MQGAREDQIPNLGKGVVPGNRSAGRKKGEKLSVVSIGGGSEPLRSYDHRGSKQGPLDQGQSRLRELPRWKTHDGDGRPVLPIPSRGTHDVDGISQNKTYLY